MTRRMIMLYQKKVRLFRNRTKVDGVLLVVGAVECGSKIGSAAECDAYNACHVGDGNLAVTRHISLVNVEERQ